MAVVRKLIWFKKIKKYIEGKLSFCQIHTILSLKGTYVYFAVVTKLSCTHILCIEVFSSRIPMLSSSENCHDIMCV